MQAERERMVLDIKVKLQVNISTSHLTSVLKFPSRGVHCAVTNFGYLLLLDGKMQQNE